MANGISSKPRKRSAQWAAQFLVAAELERQGCDVAFTMGNCTPVADLMGGFPKGEQFWVDVKGQHKPSSWNGKAKPARLNLFYILVLVGRIRTKDRFFVLTQAEFNGLVEQYRRDHRKANKPIGGFNWTEPHKFEDQWSKLPGWGAPSK
jgi:hypothetical protein